MGEETGGLSREEIAAGAGAGARSPALPRIIRNKKRRVQVAPTSRRLFDMAARLVFLEWFAGTGNLSLSARKAGFHYRTVLRHRADDVVFRGEFDLAHEQSEVRIEAWLTEAKDAGLAVSEPSGFDPAGVALEGVEPGEGMGAAEGAAEAGPGAAEASLGAAEADGHAPAHLTTEQAMQWLRASRQRKAHAAAVAGGGALGGRGFKAGRAPAAASNEEVFAALLKGMRALGVRLEAEEARRLAREAIAGPEGAETEGAEAPGSGDAGGGELADGGGAGLLEILAFAGMTGEGGGAGLLEAPPFAGMTGESGEDER